MPETPGQYLDRLESNHDILHLANQKIASLEAQLAALREALGAIVGYTYREETDAEVWVHTTARRALDA